MQIGSMVHHITVISFATERGKKMRGKEKEDVRVIEKDMYVVVSVSFLIFHN